VSCGWCARPRARGHGRKPQRRLADEQFTQEDPIGIAGGLNLYGYAGGDPINFSDPFGLCPDEDDPNCEDGVITTVSISGSAAVLIYGGNVEAGIAFHSNGYQVAYVRGGQSVGVGASAGVEVAVQRGSLSDFLEATDVAQIGEVEMSVGTRVGGNLPMSFDPTAVDGGGFNLGFGFFVGLNGQRPAAATSSWRAGTLPQETARCMGTAVGLGPTCY